MSNNESFYDAMCRQGWEYDLVTDGFHKRVGVAKPLWVSFEQAKDAFRLALSGEKVEGVAPQSESVAKIVTKAMND